MISGPSHTRLTYPYVAAHVMPDNCCKSEQVSCEHYPSPTGPASTGLEYLQYIQQGCTCYFISDLFFWTSTNNLFHHFSAYITYRIVLPQSFPNRKSYNTPKSNAFVQCFRPCPRGLSLHAVAWHLYLYLRLSPRPRENLWACRSRGGAREPVPRRRRSARSTSPSSERRRGPSTRRGGRLGTTTRAR